jgi:hypothetical protein
MRARVALSGSVMTRPAELTDLLNLEVDLL